jgi:flagellar motor switch protein FliM
MLLKGVAERVDREFRNDLGPHFGEGVSIRHMKADEKERLAEERGVVAEFTIELGDEETAFRLFYSYQAVFCLLGLAEEGAESPEADSEVEADVIRERLSRVRLPLSVRFTPTPVQLRDILALRVGDVLYLDRRMDDEVEILIGRSRAFYGHPGALGDTIGVQVSRKRE